MPHPELIIEAGSTERHYWKDVWRYRELFYFLAWRDLLVRYKQTAIGAAWSILRPLIGMAVFTVIFGELAKLPSEGGPYPILVYAAMLPWQFFTNAVSESSMSIVGNSHLITKVYFPRLLIPASSIVVSAVDFLISFAILFMLMLWYQFLPTWRLVTLPLFVIIAFAGSFGFGLWITSLNVKYRDFKYILPFMMQLGLYVSPVGFSSTIIPAKWRLLYSINPMVGVIDGFRWAILGGASRLYWPGFLLSLTLIFLVLITGIWHFRRTEKTFADIV